MPLRRLVARQRPGADRIERQARWQHQVLLRAGHGDVDTPFIVAVVDQGEQGNRIDHEQRRMPGRIDRLPDGTNAAGDAASPPGW